MTFDPNENYDFKPVPPDPPRGFNSSEEYERFKRDIFNYEDELVTRATRALQIRCNNEWRIFDCPSSYSSGIERHNEKHYVVLRNVKGVLAVYRIRNSKKLQLTFVEEEDYPEEVN